MHRSLLFILSWCCLVGVPLGDMWGVDQKPLVIDPATGRTQQLQTGNNLTLPSGLLVASTTSATTSLLGAAVIGNGVAATSVGIGGGNINAGGTVTAGKVSTYSAVSAPTIVWSDATAQSSLQMSGINTYLNLNSSTAGVGGLIVRNSNSLTTFFMTSPTRTIIGTDPGGSDLLRVGGGALFAGTVTTAAPTTAIASLNLPHGTAPTTPANGDTWTTTAGLYVRVNGATVGPLGTGEGAINKTQYELLADVTVANTITETSLITTTAGDFAGTDTLTANQLEKGDRIKIRTSGIITSNGAGQTCILRIKVGSANIAYLELVNSVNLSAGYAFSTETDAVVVTDGASGNFQCTTTANRSINTNLFAANDSAQDYRPSSLDTTASKVLAVTAQWGSAHANNTITTHTVNFTIFRP